MNQGICWLDLYFCFYVQECFHVKLYDLLSKLEHPKGTYRIDPLSFDSEAEGINASNRNRPSVQTPYSKGYPRYNMGGLVCGHSRIPNPMGGWRYRSSELRDSRSTPIVSMGDIRGMVISLIAGVNIPIIKNLIRVWMNTPLIRTLRRSTFRKPLPSHSSLKVLHSYFWFF